jgi:DNA-binding GntR family transcriptional regulator
MKEGRQLVSKRASDEIVKELRKLIITGELAPGAVVSEARLLELLGCGRTPLREAVQELSHQYILTNPPRRGIVIAHMSIDDFRQVHQAITTLDPTLIALAARRISDAQIQELKDLVAEQEEANRTGSFYELVESDGRFHSLIAEATANRYFTDIRKRLYGAVARFVYEAFRSAADASVSITEHRDIVAALEKRDAVLAEQVARQHSEGSTDRILNSLARGQPLAQV